MLGPRLQPPPLPLQSPLPPLSSPPPPRLASTTTVPGAWGSIGECRAPLYRYAQEKLQRKVARLTGRPAVRSGGHPDTSDADGLFCVGAALTTRVLLTAGTCIVAARRQTVRAKPRAASRFIDVTTHVLHPDYNSGKRATEAN